MPSMLQTANQTPKKPCLPELFARLSYEVCVQDTSLTTKFLELEDVLERYRIDLALILETDLSQEDSSPQIPDFDCVRRDRDDSGTRQQLGGGLMVYIRQSIQYSVLSCAATNLMELLVIIPLARRRQISIINVYLPLQPSDYSSNYQNDLTWLDHFPKEPSLVCMDVNAHPRNWDDHISTDRRGSALHDWMEVHSKVVFNDGSPTQAARCDQSAGVSTKNVSLVATVMVDCFSWENTCRVPLRPPHVAAFLG